MQVAFQSNPADFLKRCGSYLAQSEVEHNLILSLCQSAEKKLQRGEKVDIRFSALFDNDDFVCAAVQTPPHNLVLSKSSGLEIEKLAETLASNQFRFPGIVGPSDVSGAFANKWLQLTGQRSIEYMDQIIYVLRRALFPPSIAGELRLARPEEAKIISEWIAAFAKDALPKAALDGYGSSQKSGRDDQSGAHFRLVGAGAACRAGQRFRHG